MAIQINLTRAQTTIGAAVTGAYARIAAVHWNRYNGLVEVAVDVFWDRAARDDRKAPIWGNVYRAKNYDNEITNDQGRVPAAIDPSVDALPALANVNQGTLYTWLKTLPDFTGGTDA